MIRLGQDSDLPHLPAIEQSAARLFDGGLARLFTAHTVGIDTFRDYMEQGRLWVAVVDEHPVGFALASVIEHHAHLDEIDVHPDYGRRGLGAALVETVCAWAKAQGLDAITLSTQSNVAWNMPFYAKLGFEVMPPETWTAPYHELRAKEESLGLPIQDRVLMLRRFSKIR
jgi:ribosomal protein S18 acetylase RimI-like enzyme